MTNCYLCGLGTSICGRCKMSYGIADPDSLVRVVAVPVVAQAVEVTVPITKIEAVENANEIVVRCACGSAGCRGYGA